MTYEDWMNEVRQKAFELGGLEDGSYHLEDDELEEIIKLTLSRQAEPAPAQDEQQPVAVPQCVRDWYDAKKAHIAAVDAYNARLAFVREHEPFGTSVDPEYQIMVDAERKVRDLLVPLFIGLTDYLAAPIAQAAPQGTTSDTLIKSAKALLALDEKGSLAPHGIGGLAREVIEKLIARVEQTAPQPEQSGLSLPRTRLERIERRLTDWLELNCCECESGHSCGRNEVTADRDAIRAALSAQGSSKP